MAWTNLVVLPGNPIKASEFNALQDNFNAVANGEIGAPEIQKAALANAAVGQSQLDTTNSSINLSGAPTGQIRDAILAGGQYGFYPRCGITQGGTQNGSYRTFIAGDENLNSGGTPIATRIAFIQTSGTTVMTLNAQQRYINASPPYNLGNGPIANFTFVKLTSSGDVIGVYSAEVPPWAYNGPTDIRPDRTENENGVIKKYKNIATLPLPPWQGGDLDVFNAGPTWVEVEIDDSIKNADINLIPQPFGNLQNGERVVIIDPCDDINLTLNGLDQVGESAADVISKGYLVLGDEVTVNAPPGVTAVAAAWKNTGG
jgi:hypothetical protein